MKVAACQVPDFRDEVPKSIAAILNMASDAQEHGASIVVFPECFLQGYFTDPHTASKLGIDLGSPEFKSLVDQFEGIHATVVFGLLERSNGDLFNTAIVIESGKLVGRYRKTHLLEREKAVFEPGVDFSIFNVAGKRFGINICFDLNFPESVTRLATQGAELVVCPCNNMLSFQTAEKYRYLHNRIRSERARESNVWILSADVWGSRGGRISYGPTALINPQGEVVEELPLQATGTLIREI